MVDYENPEERKIWEEDHKNKMPEQAKAPRPKTFFILGGLTGIAIIAILIYITRLMEAAT